MLLQDGEDCPVKGKPQKVKFVYQQSLNADDDKTAESSGERTE
jgi:hypothetical protein